MPAGTVLFAYFKNSSYPICAAVSKYARSDKDNGFGMGADGRGIVEPTLLASSSNSSSSPRVSKRRPVNHESDRRATAHVSPLSLAARKPLNRVEHSARVATAADMSEKVQ